VILKRLKGEAVWLNAEEKPKFIPGLPGISGQCMLGIKESERNLETESRLA